MKTKNKIGWAMTALIGAIFPGFSGCNKTSPGQTPANYTCACYLYLNNLIIDSTTKAMVNVKLSIAIDSCDSFQHKAFHGAKSTIGTSQCAIAN